MQQDAQLSDRILDELVIKWKATSMDLLDKATWGRQVIKSRYDFLNFDTKVSPDDMAFPHKCQVVAKQSTERIILAMARLAQIKYQEENGISAEYWQKFFKDQFHLDLCVRNIWSVLKAALELQIIEKHCGWHRGRSTMYTVGQRMSKYFDVPSRTDGSISLVCKQDQLPDDLERVLEETVVSLDDQLLVSS